MPLYTDYRREEIGRGDWNGTYVPERIRVCHCGDVDCTIHADDPAAQEAERVARDTAAVIVAARMCLDAFDASDIDVPQRLHAALTDLSDALAKLQRLPF